jgi:Tfp pilus assembly protein PilO
MKPSGLKEEKDNTKKYLVSLSCEGQMEQIMDFMYNVENSRKFLTIEKYQISPKTKESSVINCTMTISKIVIP